MEQSASSAYGLMDVRSVAAYLGISERSVWSQTAPRGPLACVRLGSSVRYRPADVEAFVAGQRVEARA